MSPKKIRYFTVRRRTADDDSETYFWIPPKKHQTQGWPSKRLSDDRATAELEAQVLNRKFDEWRDLRSGKKGGHKKDRSDTPRYFSTRKGRNGMKRHYWQPTPRLRDNGWKNTRLSDDRAAAIREAELLNYRLDEWRAGICDTNNLPRTLCELINLYKRSDNYTNLRPRSQKSYDYHIRNILKHFGEDTQVRAITSRKILNFYKSRQPEAPKAARKDVVTMAIILGFAVREDMIEVNPANAIHIKKSNPRQKVWSDQAITAMIEAADDIGVSSIGTSIMIAFYIGQRQGDILALTWAQYNDGTFSIVQNKTGKAVTIPAAPELAQRLSAIRPTPYDPSTPIVACDHIDRRRRITQGHALAWNEHTFRAAFKDVKKRATELYPDLAEELSALWFMDLRRTCAVRLAEAGATETQIAAVTGHSIDRSRQIFETYIPRTGKMASAALDKLTTHRAPLFPTDPGGSPAPQGATDEKRHGTARPAVATVAIGASFAQPIRPANTANENAQRPAPPKPAGRDFLNLSS